MVLNPNSILTLDVLKEMSMTKDALLCVTSCSLLGINIINLKVDMSSYEEFLGIIIIIIIIIIRFFYCDPSGRVS